MRITLTEWREKGLPIDKGNGTDEDAGANCLGCRTMTDLKGVIQISLCGYHEGFVDGFDAREGK